MIRIPNNKQPLRGKIKDLIAARRRGGVQVVLAATLALALFGTACTSTGNTSTTAKGSSSSAPTTSAATKDTSGRTTIQSDASVMDSYDWTFSDRDMSASYDAATATKITLSDAGTTLEGTGATVQGSSVTISEEGVYVLSGSLSDGSVTVNASADTAKVQIVLAGVNITCKNGAALLVEQADKTFVTLAEGTQNTLADGSSHDSAEDGNDHDGVIFSHDDLTLNGKGSLTITAQYANGIVGKNDVRITGGMYTITATNHGIQAKDCLKIIDGTFSITAGQDGLHASNDEDDTLGYLGVGGGTFTISADDDAFHANSALLIAAGTIDITHSYEGYEGKTVSVTGGTSRVVSDDDGINASAGGGSSEDPGFRGQGGQNGGQGMMPPSNTNPQSSASTDCLLEITGGSLYVKAGGDCLDSNGTITISGGDITLECAASGGDSAIDYETTGVITGGTLLSVGPTDMAEGFSGDSTQASILLNAQSANTANAVLSVCDASGKELLSFTPTIANRSFVISSPALKEGETYTLTSGGNSLGTATAALDTQGSGMGGGAPGGGGFGGGGTPPTGTPPQRNK